MASADEACGLCHSVGDGPSATVDDTGIDVGRHVPGNGGDSGGADGSGHDSGSGSSCTTCEWSVVPACASTGELGTTSGDLCGSAATGCPTGQVLYRVYFRQSPNDPWAGEGTQCLGRGQQPAPAVDVAGAAADYFRHMPLPVPGPSFQPADGAIVNTATIFSAGSPGGQDATFNLGGMTVTVSATPAYWEWTFEPGVTQRFTSPGGGYPNKDVTYTYHSPGTRTVTVTAVWTATYTGPTGTADVTGTVSRTSPPIEVPVHEARSELISR